MMCFVKTGGFSYISTKLVNYDILSKLRGEVRPPGANVDIWFKLQLNSQSDIQQNSGRSSPVAVQ